MNTFNEWWHFLIVVLSNLAFLIPIKKSWRTKYYEISIQLAIILRIDADLERLLQLDFSLIVPRKK